VVTDQRPEVSPQDHSRPLAPNVLLIPGTRNCVNLAENLAAGDFWLGDHEIAVLNEEFS
jgi:aryl-alcohol dehydrogenase-like predicted oxidoreductase